MTFVDRIDAVNTVIHPSDALAPVYRAQYSIDEYFKSALRQVDALETLTTLHLNSPLAKLQAIADFACHYGRLLRALRVAAPDASLYACDIDLEAVSFCERHFNAQPFHATWETPLHQLPRIDLLVCISLLTHTRKTFFENTLDLWASMIRPGGLLVFTFLGEGFLESWEAGEMSHYGAATPAEAAQVSADFRAQGHAFHGYRTPYSETEYGVGFLSTDTVKAAIEKSGAFVLMEIRRGPMNEFGQDVAVAYRRHQ